MSISQNRIRCLLGMLGTDVHNKGIRTLATQLRDAGFEIIYLGEHNTCPGMVQAAIAEDVDLIGVSFSSANYLDYSRQLLEEMHANEAADIALMIGGLIHPEDVSELEEMGVARTFGPGSELAEIVEFVLSLRRAA